MMEIGGFYLLLCFLVVRGYAEFMEINFLQSHFRFRTYWKEAQSFITTFS